MKTPEQRPVVDTWDEAECKSIIEQLWTLRQSMLASEAGLATHLQSVDPSYRHSARNLVHYLALRRHDRRDLQEWLSRVGLSSLGRAESHVMANLDKVLGILHRLTGQPWEPHSTDEPVGIKTSKKLLERHTAELLGAVPSGRVVRIMVTLPSEAAKDFGLVRRLVVSGMDIARINCAHDGPLEWKAMAAHVRRAAKTMDRPVRILMDLGGPKLRTGHIPSEAAVLKLRPERDDLGRVLSPARVGIRAAGAIAMVAGATEHIGVEAPWLAQLQLGDRIEFTDARDAERHLRVVQQDEAGFLAECLQTAYLVPQTKLKFCRSGVEHAVTRVTDLPCKDGSLHLVRAGSLRLTGPTVDALPRKAKGRAPRPMPTVV